jgi:hypothetical protein
MVVGYEALCRGARPPPRPPARSPATLVGRHVGLRRGGIELVRQLAVQLLGQAAELREHAVVAASVAARPTAPAVVERLAPLAQDAALVALIGADVTPNGAHAGTVEPDEPLAQEWNLAVIGPYFAGALVARLADAGDDTCDFALTHDPELAVEVADFLLARTID